ncbi:hypothetical protein A2U01_0077376 [Trifolium medium]|uniref:Uncharacterized protein n=1 Tax=Trifolium medium TaxID=97028 RepID=A0A392T752_9FABA|nr:hypothetical protein [Trifolium medium]
MSGTFCPRGEGEFGPASCSAAVGAPRQDVVEGHFPGEEVTSSYDVSAGESCFFVGAEFFPVRQVSDFVHQVSYFVSAVSR